MVDTSKYKLDQEGMLTKGSTGTGLTVPKGPQGLSIAASPFTSLPDQTAAVVDVYDKVAPGVINNGKLDATGGGFFDDIAGKIGGIKDKVLNGAGGIKGTLKETASGLSGIKDTLSKGITATRNVTALASKAITAVDIAKRGGIGNILTGAGQLAGTGGLSGIADLANTGTRVANGLKYGGVSGALNAAGSTSLLNGSIGPIARVASQAVSVSRAVTNVSNANGILGTLSAVDRSVALASSTIGSLGKAAEVDFSAAFDKVITNTTKTNYGNLDATKRSIDNVISDVSSALPTMSKSSISGVGSGLIVVGSKAGDNTVYSRLSEAGLGNENLYAIGVSGASISASSGNIELLKDITSIPVGKSAAGSLNGVVSTTVKNMQYQNQTQARPLTSIYDDIISVANTLGEPFMSTSVGGKTVPDVSIIKAGTMAADVMVAKANSLANDAYASLKTTPLLAKPLEISELGVIISTASA